MTEGSIIFLNDLSLIVRNYGMWIGPALYNIFRLNLQSCNKFQDLKLLGTSYPHLNVNSVVDDVMVATNDNMSAEGELYLDIHVNFYDFFNVLCGCALVIKHSSPTPYHIHSHMGVSSTAVIIWGELMPHSPLSQSNTGSTYAR